jgi:hypothetical protein
MLMQLGTNNNRCATLNQNHTSQLQQLIAQKSEETSIIECHCEDK